MGYDDGYVNAAEGTAEGEHLKVLRAEMEKMPCDGCGIKVGKHFHGSEVHGLECAKCWRERIDEEMQTY